MMEKKILVFGATGTQGHPVVEALAERGYGVRAASRDPQAARETLPPECEIVQADLGEPDSLEVAMKGVDVVFFHMPILPDNRSAPAFLANLIAACDKQQVRRLIYTTSGFSRDNMPPGPFVDGLRKASQAVLERDGEAVVLRPTLYLANLVWPHLVQEIRAFGRLRYPPLAHERRISWTATEDQASIVAACIDADVAGQCLDIASPEPVTGPELCQLLAGVYGREVHYAPGTPDEFADDLGKRIGSADAARAIAGLYQGIDSLPPDGAIVDTQGLETRLGLKLTPVSRWMKERLEWLMQVTGV